MVSGISKPPSDNYRPNVAAIIMRGDGRILIAERVKPTGAWQFPQGGVSPGESELSALRREVREEVGLRPKDYEIISSHGGYYYTFPKGKLKKGRYRGQSQTYYLLRSKEIDPPIDLTGSPGEFRQAAWIFPHQFELSWLPGFKRDTYRAVLYDFFQVELTE